MEMLTFAVPVQVEVRTMRIASLVLDWEHLSISVALQQWDEAAGAFVSGGTRVTAGWSGNDAWVKMVALNKVNLSTKSLHTRVMEALVADGKISPAVIAGEAP